MTTSSVNRYADGALTKASNALNSVKTGVVNFAVKAKEITLLALSKIGELLSILGKTVASYSKIAFNNVVVFGKYVGGKVAIGGHYVINHAASAASLTKGFVMSHPQVFSTLGIATGIGALAVCATYYLVKS